MKARSIAAISAALGLVAMACTPTSDSTRLPDPDAAPTADSTATASIDVEGHRGARGTRPENTLPSFEAALDAGVNTLELDLHLSRDGELVIWHDPEIATDKCRTEDETVPDPITSPMVRSLTASELSKYICDLNPDPRLFPDQEAEPGDVSEGDYSVKTLEQLFEFVVRYSSDDGKSEDQRKNATTVQFNVETKRSPERPETIGDSFDGTSPGEFEQAVAAVIEDWVYQDRVVVQSFDHRSLWALGTIAPNVRLAALTVDERPDLQALSDSGATIWSPRFTSLSANVVADAQSLGLDVIPWTVNTASDVCALVGMGVDGLITDRPDLVLGEGGWLERC